MISLVNSLISTGDGYIAIWLKSFNEFPRVNMVKIKMIIIVMVAKIRHVYYKHNTICMLENIITVLVHSPAESQNLVIHLHLG